MSSLKKFACLTLASLLLLAGCAPHEHSYTDTVILPTCTEMGYTAHTCACGDTYFSDYRATVPHTYGDWVAGVEATLTSGGESYRICKTCGNLQTKDTESTSALPKVYLGAEGVLSYSHGDLQFTCESGAAAEQGTDKPAITLSLSKNGAPFPVDLGWGEQSVYRLDPCIPDLTYARAAAAEVVLNACKQLRESASDAPEWYAAPLQGGFPVQVYSGEVYLGLYRLTPPPGDWACAFSGFHGSPTAVLSAVVQNEGTLFLANPAYGEGDSGFAVLHCSTESADWAKESFGGFSRFIRQASDDEMKKQLSQYTDVTALMDHFLLTVYFGSGNGDTTGTLWSTADGVHWIPSFSPLHTAYGLTEKGVQTSATLGVPAPDGEGGVSYQGDSLLWQRLCKVFGEELKTRYAQLRATVLRSPAILYESFLQQQKGIEAGLLETESTLQPEIAENAVTAETLSRYIQTRLSAMDQWMGYVR